MNDSISVSEITSPDEKKAISREILEALPDWFGIPEAREEYIEQSAGEIFFAALEGEKALGFRELEVFPTLWDECNPCQIYIMHIGG